MAFSFTNLARANEIGANCYHVESGGQGVVLDAGMHPKAEGLDALPALELLDRKPVDAAFLTHAHHDHAGALPLLQARHPDVRTFMSEPTTLLAAPLLHNSVSVMKRQRLEHGIAEYPLYTHGEIDRAARRWQAVGLGRKWSIRGYPMREEEQEPFVFKLHHAGHILGSVGVEIRTADGCMFYTGDVCFHEQTLMSAAQFPQKDIDVLVLECTRGAQPSEDYCRQKTIDHLIDEIQQTFERGGSVLMPIFAMGKTQELLTVLHAAQMSGRLPLEPIYIGGLGKVFSTVYDKTVDCAVRKRPELSIFRDIQPQIFDLKKISAFKLRRNQLLLLPSGMMTPQTTSCRLAPSLLNDPKNAVIFVGYTDPDSPAGKLRATSPGEKIRLSRESEPVTVRCPVRHFDFTSHALREALLEYVLRVRPRHCVLVHGDPAALAWFRDEISSKDQFIKVVIPAPGETLTLE